MLIFFLLFSLNLSAKEPVLEIVSYNVQNLFDANHDVGNEDYPFLPLENPYKVKGCKKLPYNKRASCEKLDWNERSVDLKISQIKKAIGSPDVLVIIEIESEIVAKKLSLELGLLNYVLSSEHDNRGIRTSFFFKKGKILRKREIPIKNSRSILEIKIEFLKGDPVTFFINHWPSQKNSSFSREYAGEQLLKRLNQLQNEKIIILGDFNFDPRFEGNSLFENDKFIDLSPKFEPNPGTYFYIPEKKWSGFDRILISKNLSQRVKNFKILRKAYLEKEFMWGEQKEKIPFRYNHSSSDPLYAGFSDHFPVQMKLMLIPEDGKKF